MEGEKRVPLPPSPPSAPRTRRAPSRHSIEQLNRVIARVYDAAVESQMWPAALAEILRFVGNSGTHLWLMNGATSEVSHSIHVGMPDNLIEEYNGEVIKECPRWANARAHPDRTLLFDYQHIDEREIDSNEYYNWLHTKGDQIRYYLGGRLRIGSQVEGFQSLAFRKKEGHAQKKHIERFLLILPHVERAMQIGHRLGTWRLVFQSTLEVLNRLPHGVIILDGAGRALTVNKCAEEILRPPCPVALRAGRFVARDSGIERRLHGLIGACAATAGGRGQFPGGGLTIPAGQGAAPLRFHVCPLKLPPETFQVRQSAVVVFLLGADVETQVDDTVLRTTFDLTMAESRLAASLLGGATLNEASKKLHVSRNTAHTQLKSIFAKVGVHRRAELIRVLLPLSVRRQPR